MANIHSVAKLAKLIGSLSVILSSTFTAVQSAIPKFTCPPPGSTPVKVPLPVKNSTRTVYVVHSQSDTLCTLSRLTPLKPNAALVEMDSWDMVPIARSYLNYDWEPSAGPYAAKLVVSSCDGKKCTLVIPSLPSTDPNAILVLMSYKYSIDAQSEAARFLEQATFGPTRESVAQLGDDLSNNIPAWIQNQMDPYTVPLTSHRESFRRQVGSAMEDGRAWRTGTPKHPCEPYSRWRLHSFTMWDRGQNVKISITNDGRHLISVNGVPRTVVQDLTLVHEEVEKVAAEGSYTLCWWIENRVGGYLDIQPENESICYGVEGGNPVVNLPSSILNDYYDVIPRLNLPPISDFTETETILYGHYSDIFYGGAGKMYVSSALYDYSGQEQCDSLPLGDFANLLGLFESGEQAYYDGRIELDTNTLESPIPDGGGKKAMGGTLCSNVPKNFLNIDSCVLSYETTSCSPYRANPRFTLTKDVVLQFFQVTGRFVYIIRNLQMTAVESPCTPYVRHRWVIITDTNCGSPGVDGITLETLSWLMMEYGNWDSNDLLVDIHLEWIGGYGRTCNSANTIGMKLLVNDVCYKHIHPDEYSVYDFSYWALPDTHPGNAQALELGHRNPIRKWADDGLPELLFPTWHAMDRWNNNKESFDYIGRFGNSYEYFDLPTKLRTKAMAEALGAVFNDGDAVVVCGSSGEIANDPNLSYLDFSDQTNRDVTDQINQKKNLWNAIAISANDQLRQRMAWALSQILVVTPNQIQNQEATEIYANYYDIFVRHAFGNYRDVLKEVAYSPMMAEMLSFLESKSSAYVLRETREKAYPDENFAREIMQLFTIGVQLLNIDGTPKVDPSSGLPIPTYQNDDIQVFARAWTGFYQQERRSNIELGGDWEPNRIDPMRINPDWRDVFPKKDLNDGFIGDSYPLCSDLPDKQFLRKGAKYILLGSSSLSEFQSGDSYWWADLSDDVISRMTLDPNSKLRKILCNPSSSESGCNFQSVVVLEENLQCTAQECNLDNLRAFKVQQDPPVYYEYLRPACVELSFYNTGKKINKRWPDGNSPNEVMCANTAVDEVMDACCPPRNVYWGGAKYLCKFTGERVKYATGVKRCKEAHGVNAGYCDWEWLWNNGEIPADPPKCLWWTDYAWHWTNMTCTVRVKVGMNGDIAIVHNPDLTINNFLDDYFQDYYVRPEFDMDNTNYFPVKWGSGSFPSPKNGCGNGVCGLVGGTCQCDINVVETRVFSATPSDVTQVLTRLFIGSLRPDLYSSGYTAGSSPGEVKVYHRNGGTPFDMTTIFGVAIKGRTLYFKNMQSMVVIRNSSGKRIFWFRNPPHFMSFITPDIRDASYETDAVLDHYFFHDNLAPFLATRIIQRFGISNPSPRYVQQVARAFTDGNYMSTLETSFGDNKYGSLSALLAATLLDREARSVVLDVDPTSGSIREPMIKLIAFFRALDFYSPPTVKEITFENLQSSIGQMPHSIPNVFSFFLPDYASGKIKAASLFSPESQVLTTPTIIGFINGIFSLVDLGLTDCYGGFGELTTWWCDGYNDNDYSWKFSRGYLGYPPLHSTPNDVTDVLATLLTAGRLNGVSRQLIKESSSLNTVLKLIVTTPEYHSTRVATPLKLRPNMIVPQPSGTPYKAIIFVNLEGGMDSYNLLIPHSGCSGTKYLYDQYASIRGELAIPQSDLLQIDASTSSQPCKTFGLHPNLGALQQLYNDGDLTFLANAGVLQQYVNKDNWFQKTTKTSLFAHNTQQDEVNNVDIFDIEAGSGVLGRMIDILIKNGLKASSMSISGIASALVSKLSPLFVIDPYNYEKVNPIPWAEDILGHIKVLNNANRLGGNLFGDAWSSHLVRSLNENKLLYDAITNTKINTAFPDRWLAQQMEVIAKMIKTKNVRGSDRDIFFADLGGFDTHSNMVETFAERMTEINEAVGAFATEMKSQSRWNDVVLVFVSEFARTLTPNTSRGSDHAWGGNYFYAGGSVTGKRILGKYPSDLTSNSQYRFDPGVVIPTTSWDEFWELVAKWYGITADPDLTLVLPNRKAFNGLGTTL